MEKFLELFNLINKLQHTFWQNHYLNTFVWVFFKKVEIFMSNFWKILEKKNLFQLRRNSGSFLGKKPTVQKILKFCQKKHYFLLLKKQERVNEYSKIRKNLSCLRDSNPRAWAIEPRWIPTHIKYGTPTTLHTWTLRVMGSFRKRKKHSVSRISKKIDGKYWRHTSPTIWLNSSFLQEMFSDLEFIRMQTVILCGRFSSTIVSSTVLTTGKELQKVEIKLIFPYILISFPWKKTSVYLYFDNLTNDNFQFVRGIRFCTVLAVEFSEAECARIFNIW